MPTSDQLIEGIQTNEAALAVTQKKHEGIKLSVNLGPMDDITPCTPTGAQINYLKEIIAQKKYELGEQVLRERAG